MGEDEEATVLTLTGHREMIFTIIKHHQSRVVNSPDDNLLAEFESVLQGVNCAVEIQRELAERNAELPKGRIMEFRIGVNLGDIIKEGERTYGMGSTSPHVLNLLLSLGVFVFLALYTARSKRD